MDLLFCNNPFDEKKVDPDFAYECSTAEVCGFTVHLFSFEQLTKECDLPHALKRVPRSAVLKPIIYRGWMLKPMQYRQLYEALLVRNWKLINSPEEYQHCHYLPESYSTIETNTPKTVWVHLEDGTLDYKKLFDSIQVFGTSPLIVKDFVKSQKHNWDTACYIPSASNMESVRSVVDRFMHLQGSDLNEGIVIREFVTLEDLTVHSKSGMPLTKEYRLFFLHGKLVAMYNYWEEGEYHNEEQPPPCFTTIVQAVKSRFFSMDVAKTKQGDWIIIELGDGQVAGLPTAADPLQFYSSMAENFA